MISNRTQIIIDGWRPWSKRQQNVIGFNAGSEVSPDFDYLRHLRIILDTLYDREVETYNKFKKIKEEESCPLIPINVTMPAVDTDSKPIFQTEIPQENSKQSAAQNVENT